MNFYMKSGDMSPVVTLKSPMVTLKSPVVTCHLVTCQELFINESSCRVSEPLMIIINHYSCLKCDCKCGPALAGQQSSQLNDFGWSTQQFGLHLAEESPANLRD